MAHDSEFAVKLRALRARAGNPTQAGIGEAVGRTHSIVGYTLRGQHTPPWDTAAAIVEFLGGDPAEFRGAWEKSRTVPERRTRGPVVPNLHDLRVLLVRSDRLGDDIRAYLGRVTPGMLVPALPPGRLAEYRISGAGSRDVSVWHASAECLKQSSGIAHDLAEALEWVLEHEQEGHGGGS
jgi:hypothetical protein